MEKDNLEQNLEEVNNYSELIKLYREANLCLKKKKLINQDIIYIEQQIRNKFFNSEVFDKYSTKVILKQIVAYVKDIEDFDESKLSLIEVGETVEETRTLQDVACLYEEKFVSLFGILKDDYNLSKKYNLKKYMKPNFFEVVKSKSNKGECKIEQYGDYFILKESDRLCIYKEKPITALVNVEQTAFDKMKLKLMSFFDKNIFTRNKFLPNMMEVYNTNKLKQFDLDASTTSKSKAKNRMKNVLIGDRIRTRVKED
ncbi:MAG: hypothetical protein Q4G05_02080 [Clostridia bacterium]|nr:hypothetical protein [Clostridia bacterium]